ncbi:hypothetical protein HELRODRAFT_168161 [Helobdella robusta]|uniref:Ricin B lectin domain-containing protein n=1 Tax=Helobdella robusta TaxID=6412 RepID=T1F090_HELRO|nr:hypothetical protein HELRODRAFT_168161 [Helobdella robusta]ESO09202.1 hypothetical protein HELRODRAFT_168161 [Helobdella robusta]
MFIDIDGKNPGSRLITNVADESDTQLWYDEPISGCIKNKSNNLCLDLQDSDPTPGAHLVVNRTNYNVNQGFEFTFVSTIENCQKKYSTPSPPVHTPFPPNPPQIYYAKTDIRNECLSRNDSPSTNFQSRKFYIVNDKHSKVLTIEYENTLREAHAVLSSRSYPPALNQLWYVQADGIISSYLNDFMIDNADGKIKMKSSIGNPFHKWESYGKHVTDEIGDCLANREKPGVKICNLFSAPCQDVINEEWRFEYVSN